MSLKKFNKEPAMKSKSPVRHNESKSEYIETVRQNNMERKKYTAQVFRLTWFWIAIIFAMLLLQGFRVIFLSDAILKTLITVTITSCFFFLVPVYRYLFNKKK